MKAITSMTIAISMGSFCVSEEAEAELLGDLKQ
jgi:hypothetical protein